MRQIWTHENASLLMEMASVKFGRTRLRISRSDRPGAPASRPSTTRRPIDRSRFSTPCIFGKRRVSSAAIASFWPGQKGDPRPDLIEKLLDDPGTTGSTVVHHAEFETARIRELAAFSPAHSDALLALLPRIVDTEIPFKRSWYLHPGLEGAQLHQGGAPGSGARARLQRSGDFGRVDGCNPISISA